MEYFLFQGPRRTTISFFKTVYHMMQMVQSRSAPEDYGDRILLKFILSVHETIKAP